jgi:uncharacterized membrane protein YtjA (UPF0391 family)
VFACASLLIERKEHKLCQTTVRQETREIVLVLVKKEMGVKRNDTPPDPGPALAPIGMISAVIRRERSREMLYYALVFLVVGLIAGVLGIAGIAAMATQIAWVLFLIGIVLLVFHLISGRPGQVL